MLNSKRIARGALVLAIAAGNALASPMIYDGFNYPAGQPLNLQNGGTGFSEFLEY